MRYSDIFCLFIHQTPKTIITKPEYTQELGTLIGFLTPWSAVTQCTHEQEAGPEAEHTLIPSALTGSVNTPTYFNPLLPQCPPTSDFKCIYSTSQLI